MRLAKFNGGLNLLYEPHFIDPSEAVEYTNVEHIRGILQPIADKTEAISSINKYSFFFVAENRWVSFATETHFVEYKERLYYTQPGQKPKKIIGGVTYNLGLAPPTAAIGLAVTEAPKDVTRFEMTDTVSGDFPANISVRYRLINKNTTTDLIAKGLDEYTFNTNGAGTTSVTFSTEDTNFANNVRIYRYFDGAWRYVNILINNTGGLANDLVYDISANDELVETSLVEGTVQYALSFVSSVDGAESGPKLSDEVTVSNGKVTISNLQVSTDPQVTTKRLYRIGNNITAFTLVAELPNATTSYEDDLADDELEGSLYQQEDTIEPFTGLQYLTEANGMMFAALVDRLYFTPIGEPWDWRENYYLDLPRPITGLAKTSPGLIVMDAISSRLVSGTGPEVLAQSPLSGDQGCLNHLTIQYFKDVAIWVSVDGIAISNGGSVELVTEPKFDTIDLESVNAVFHKRKYIVQLTDGRSLYYDFRSKTFKYCEYVTDFLVVAENVLYGYYDGKLYTIETALTDLPFSYRSGNLSAGSLTVFKGYKNIYIKVLGQISVNIFIDNVLVSSYAFNTVSLSNEQMKVPTKKGFHIAFAITGTGKVYEINFDEAPING